MSALKKQRGQQVTGHSDDKPLAGLYAAALGLLLAGLSGDGAAVARETDRIIAAGPRVTGPVLGFMTAAASNAYEHEYGGREAAIAEVERQLSAVLSEAADSTDSPT
jgi:hypothetical protein